VDGLAGAHSERNGMEHRPVQFLLVEDDDSHAMITMRTLRDHQLPKRVDRVSDGLEAMAYLRREGPYADRPRPDIILLDLKLPRLDGHEVLERVKGDPDLRCIPIVILTTSDAEADRMKAYQHYANSYLVKPIGYERFREMADELSDYWGAWNRPARD
jgi:CheY-like chemotaxis protein